MVLLDRRVKRVMRDRREFLDSRVLLVLSVLRAKRVMLVLREFLDPRVLLDQLVL